MPSLFSAPTYTPGAALPQRSIQELQQTPAAQSREAASGTSYRESPQGAGLPAGTGATAEPTPVTPAPAPTPAVSTSQTGRMTALVIDMQARQDAVETDELGAEASEAQSEAIRESAAPRGTDQQSVEFRERRSEIAEAGGPEEASVGTSEAEDPARQAAQNYRDANETTSGVEPAKLLMDA